MFSRESRGGVSFFLFLQHLIQAFCLEMLSFFPFFFELVMIK